MADRLRACALCWQPPAQLVPFVTPDCSKLGCIAVPLPSHVGPLCLRPPPGLSPPQKGSGKLGYEAEAFAIYDTMRYIKPPVATVCVGSAFGEAAMLLAAGEPGRRAALPSTSIMIRQPMQRFTQMQARRGAQPLCLSTYCGYCWRAGPS